MVIAVLKKIERNYRNLMDILSPVKKGNATKETYAAFKLAKEILGYAQWGIEELVKGSDFGIVERVLLKEGIISKYGQDEGVFYGA